MTGAVIAALLALVVLAAWIGCAGFARLRTPLDRMHCVAFVNATAGLALTVAAFVSDGLSDRALKILLMAATLLLVGSAMSHATGRAIGQRRQSDDPDAPGEADA